VRLPEYKGADYRLFAVQFPNSTLNERTPKESQRCEKKHSLSSWHSAAQ
jgi:hypothetical protein